MKKILLMAVLFAAVPARALFLGGVDQTFGKKDYKGTNVYAGLNLGNLSVTPEWRRWSGTRKMRHRI